MRRLFRLISKNQTWGNRTTHLASRCQQKPIEPDRCRHTSASRPCHGSDTASKARRSFKRVIMVAVDIFVRKRHCLRERQTWYRFCRFQCTCILGFEASWFDGSNCLPSPSHAEVLEVDRTKSREWKWQSRLHAASNISFPAVFPQTRCLDSACHGVDKRTWWWQQRLSSEDPPCSYVHIEAHVYVA